MITRPKVRILVSLLFELFIGSNKVPMIVGVAADGKGCEFKL